MNHDLIATPQSPDQSTSRNKTITIFDRWFDWLMIGANFWMIAGLYLDGWAHHHLDSSLETFFTPWHGVFYSGMLLSIGMLMVPVLRLQPTRIPWKQRVPPGYAVSLIGIPILLVGGISDSLWHTLFGIEIGVEALLSPPHLMLAFGMGFIVTGPYRAGMRRGVPPSTWQTQLPMVLSMTLTLSLITFFTQFVHPLGEPWTILAIPHDVTVPMSVRQELGAASILVATIVVIGSVMMLLRGAMRLPPYSMTLLIGVNALGMSIFQDLYVLVPSSVLAGIIADGMLHWQRVSEGHRGVIAYIAIIIPLVIHGSTFATALIQNQFIWSIHLWAGTLVLASFTGWLVQYAMRPADVQRYVVRDL